MSGIEAAIAALDGITIETQPQRVRRRSRDFYWYSPVLRRQLDHVTGDAVALVTSEEEVIAVLAACHAHDVPVTVRGGGTGNYGQAMPLQGGMVLDLSGMTTVKEVRQGRVRVEPGAKICDVDAACQDHSAQELRLHPSTHKTGTIGGYIAGGSSGVGSITWGLLRDRGNILGLRVVTMEAEPRVLELRGADIQKVNHAFGTNGVITELELPLAPAFRWYEAVIGFDDFMTAARFADALAREDAILKKLVTPIAAPIGHDYLMPDLVGPKQSIVIVMVADIAVDALHDLMAGWPCRELLGRFADERERNDPPLFEYTWNHTTLHALKVDRNVTYLQTLFPPPGHLDLVARMHELFGNEVALHLEFVRFGGQIACFGLQIVHFTDEARLNEIIGILEAAGCPVFNPHAYTLEEGGMKKVDPDQLAFKREADPKGLMNPGKMLGWTDPAWDGTSGRTFLYD